MKRWLSLCSFSLTSHINHTWSFDLISFACLCSNSLILRQICNILQPWCDFYDGQRDEDESLGCSYRWRHLRAVACYLLSSTAVNPNSEAVYVAIYFFLCHSCLQMSVTSHWFAIAMKDSFEFVLQCIKGHAINYIFSVAKKSPCCCFLNSFWLFLLNVLLGWRILALIHPHSCLIWSVKACSTSKIQEDFRGSQCIMLACYVKSITHTDVYHNTTLIYQVQNVPSHCATADISELWSVKIRSVCAALKAVPPVQTLFPPPVWCGFVENQKHRALLWPPLPVTRSSPVCLWVKRPQQKA